MRVRWPRLGASRVAYAFLVYMLPPIPRCGGWASASLVPPIRINLPRYGSRVGPHIVLFEACSAFTRVAACTLALSPIRDTLIEGFSHFVASMTAPIASGWSGCRVGIAPTEKRRLCTAHANKGHSMALYGIRQSLRPAVERLSSYPNEFESSACATNSRRSMVEIQCTKTSMIARRG
jgi:hypothetical protein